MNLRYQQDFQRRLEQHRGMAPQEKTETRFVTWSIRHLQGDRWFTSWVSRTVDLDSIEALDEEVRAHKALDAGYPHHDRFDGTELLRLVEARWAECTIVQPMWEQGSV